MFNLLPPTPCVKSADNDGEEKLGRFGVRAPLGVTHGFMPLANASVEAKGVATKAALPLCLELFCKRNL
jgi:hypothetical protein